MTPELEKAVESETRGAQSVLDAAALYVTWGRSEAPSWAQDLVQSVRPETTAITAFIGTVGPGLDAVLAEALARQETLKARILTALGEELADQAAAFVERLAAEEAQEEALEILDRRDLRSSPALRPLLETLEASRLGLGADEGGRLSPRFTRAGLVLWGPHSKKRK